MKSSPPLSLTILSAAFMLTACRKDPPVIPSQPPGNGVLKVRFVPEWEGQPFQPFVELHNFSGYRVQVEKVQFYVSDLRPAGIAGISDTVEIMFVDLIDGPVDTIMSVTAQQWEGLQFGLGVKEELNHSDPVLYANDHPLSSSLGMHWDWTQGYIFTKFEGRHDTIPDSAGPFPNTYSIHTGFDTAYVDVDLQSPSPMIVMKDDTLELTVKVAIDRFFHSDETQIDLATEYMSHGTNIPLSLKLAHNVAKSFSIE